MSDFPSLAERLRQPCDSDTAYAQRKEAADEIERLRALLPRLRDYISAERTTDRPKDAMLELIDKALEGK